MVRLGADPVRHLRRHQPAPGRGRVDVTPRSAHDRRQRRVLIGLALIFFGPLGVSFYLYYGHASWHPGGRVNPGDLIVPPRPWPPRPRPLQGPAETGSE